MRIGWMKTRFYIGFLLMITCLYLAVGTLSAFAEPEQNSKITIEFFYQNACGACSVEQEFIDELDLILIDERDGVEIELLTYNTFQLSSMKKLEEYKKTYNLSKDESNYSKFVFINNTYLVGSEQISEGILNEFIKAKASVKQSIVYNQDISQENSMEEVSQSTIMYFYVTPCAACEAVNNFFETLDKEYTIDIHGIEKPSELKIKKYNVSESQNLELIREYFSIYEVPESKQEVPIVFIGDLYLQGDKEIQIELQDKIEAGNGMNTLIIGDAGQITDAIIGYKALGVFFTGFINGFNPCSLSMLLLFLSMLIISNKNVLKLGTAFIAGKFVTYFALGTLLYNLFSKISGDWFYKVQDVMKIVLLIILAFLIFMNIRDYFAVKNEEYGKIKMQLPVALRRFNHKWIKKISELKNTKFLFIVSFGLGMLISLGEFLCTGQIYLATIVYVLQTSTVFDLNAAMYFLLYGIALIIPLVLLTFIIHKGKEVLDISEIIRGKLHIIKLVNAIVFLLFAIIVLILF